MNELEDRVDELECENEELCNRLSDLEGRFEAFAKPCAISVEQLWQIVREDIQGLPVPNGLNDVDLRDLL